MAGPATARALGLPADAAARGVAQASALVNVAMVLNAQDDASAGGSAAAGGKDGSLVTLMDKVVTEATARFSADRATMCVRPRARRAGPTRPGARRAGAGERLRSPPCVPGAHG